MRIFDALLGRVRPVGSSLDALFGMSVAVISLQAELGLTPTGGAALSFRPVSSGDFAAVEREIRDLLNVDGGESGLTWRTTTDSYGYEWVLVQAGEFENVVATVHMLSRELEDAGYGEQLLAAVFQFKDERGRNVYWVYSYKRGSWYPFVPAPNASRDNATELRLSAVMQDELKTEPDLTRWYAIWGIPLP